MMPELDSHTPSPSNPTPLATEYSLWHACGKDFEKYSAGMQRCKHLKLISVTLRLAPGQTNVEKAAQQWQDFFGVQKEASESVFTNARMKFVSGVDGQPEGLESITLGVKGKDKLENMLRVVEREGLCGDGSTNMLGVKWYFVLLDDERLVEHGASKL
jgi:hypothetical protein